MFGREFGHMAGGFRGPPKRGGGFNSQPRGRRSDLRISGRRRGWKRKKNGVQREQGHRLGDKPCCVCLGVRRPGICTHDTGFIGRQVAISAPIC